LRFLAWIAGSTSRIAG